jgi:hypothetical protein
MRPGDAWRNDGSVLPAAWADLLGARLANGTLRLLTVEGEKFARPGDWLMGTPDGLVVLPGVVFEALFGKPAHDEPTSGSVALNEAA